MLSFFDFYFPSLLKVFQPCVPWMAPTQPSPFTPCLSRHVIPPFWYFPNSKTMIATISVFGLLENEEEACAASALAASAPAPGANRGFSPPWLPGQNFQLWSCQNTGTWVVLSSPVRLLMCIKALTCRNPGRISFLLRNKSLKRTNKQSIDRQS